MKERISQKIILYRIQDRIQKINNPNLSANTVHLDTSITHIRPRFHFVVPHDKQQLMERIQQLKAASAKKVIVRILDDHIMLDIPSDVVHYWSPQINFRMETDHGNPAQTVVHGLIGPRPAVWTLFMFIYFTIGIIGFVVGSFGVSHWMLGTFSPLVWAFPLAFLFMLTAYKAGKYGEQLGKEQIVILKQFVRDALMLD